MAASRVRSIGIVSKLIYGGVGGRPWSLQGGGEKTACGMMCSEARKLFPPDWLELLAEAGSQL